MASNLDADSLSADLPHGDHKTANKEEHLEHVGPIVVDLVYDDIDHEPELHIRTWIALASMVLFNLVCTFAVLSPPAVVSIQNTIWRVATI